MRSDYALYTVGIIFFVITVIVFASPIEEAYKSLGAVTTAILGILSIGIGYIQRPKAKLQPAEAPPPPPTIPPTPPTPQIPMERVEEKIVEAAVQAKIPLTEVKGIGEKRADQLKALGISNVEELAKASAQELASKLKISPKITQKWIENAKKLAEKT